MGRPFHGKVHKKSNTDAQCGLITEGQTAWLGQGSLMGLGDKEAFLILSHEQRNRNN